MSSPEAQRGTLVHEETIRVAPDADAAKLGEAERGHELVIIETSRDWTHVEAIIREPKKDSDEDDPGAEGKTITGWVQSKALVSMTTPNGDKIIFGEAANSEDEASRRRGRRDAAQDALRLYYRVYDLFPTSPLAAEGLYRAADIRWQVERSDVLTRPSARERDAYMRGQIDEQWMKLVIKKFPGTKWADLAAFHLLENKLCGDWQGASKCPDKEADMYEKYVKEHEQSPSAPEALYHAAWRRTALIEIYKTEANRKNRKKPKTALSNWRKKLSASMVKRLGLARSEPDLLRSTRRTYLRKHDGLNLANLSSCSSCHCPGLRGVHPGLQLRPPHHREAVARLERAVGGP